MYLTETDLYKGFFMKVKEMVTKDMDKMESDYDIYAVVSEIKGMTKIIDNLMEEGNK